MVDLDCDATDPLFYLDEGFGISNTASSWHHTQLHLSAASLGDIRQCRMPTLQSTVMAVTTTGPSTPER